MLELHYSQLQINPYDRNATGWIKNPYEIHQVLYRHVERVSNSNYRQQSVCLYRRYDKEQFPYIITQTMEPVNWVTIIPDTLFNQVRVNSVVKTYDFLEGDLYRLKIQFDASAREGDRRVTYMTERDCFDRFLEPRQEMWGVKIVNMDKFWLEHCPSMEYRKNKMDLHCNNFFVSMQVCVTNVEAFEDMIRYGIGKRKYLGLGLVLPREI